MTQLKSSFKVDTKLQAFYTEGKIQIDKNGDFMFCGCGQKVQMIDIKSSNLVASFSKEEEIVTNFILSPDNEYLIVASQNLLLRQWHWRERKLVRSWRTSHRTPIVSMAMDKTSTLLATGSTDLTIKVWDIVQEHCTHDLTGHKGVICAMEFNPDKSRLQLVSASDDNLIRIWDLMTSTCVSEISAHYSTVTSLIFTPDGNTMYSTGRDSVVITWNMVELKVSKTLPVFERLESIIPVNPDILDYDIFKLQDHSTYYITAGNKGNLSIYQHDNGKCVYSKKLVTVDGGKSEDEQVITQALYHPILKQFIVVTYDHNIILADTQDFTIQKQFAGYMDEVLDLQFIGKDDSHIIVITNSEKIKVYERSSWKCQILTGHTDIVLNISVHKQSALFASSAKDSTIRVWKFDEDIGNITCVAIASGHIQAVGAVCLAKTKADFVISGSEDNTLKKWELPALDESRKDVVTLKAVATDIAHEKDINFIDISPNDKFIATCSLDKTAKIWRESDLSLLGVMRGHRRGVWCIQFSPVDQCVLTGSADSTIKIWSLQDFSCVKTFEGHSASVLRTMFISNGMQILSCGADGVLKLWTIKTNECIKSYDDHNGKIWALTTNTAENTVVTGAADSTVIFWKDVTEEEREETLKIQEDLILKEQQLSNLIQKKKYLKALSLAITLEQPYKVLSIIKAILKENEGIRELEITLSKLQMYQVDAILRFAVTWNTNSKHCQEAQFIIGVIFNSFSPNQLIEFPNIQSTLEGLLSYTDRHFKRMNRLLQQSMFVDYTWTCMGRIDDNPSQSIEAMEEGESDFVISRKGSHIEANHNNSDSESDGSDSENELDDMSRVKKDTVKTPHKPDSDSDSSSEESDMEVTDLNKKSKFQKEVKNTVKENSPIVHVTRNMLKKQW
ncbi:hypothetical protein LOTGIDRAFT_221859 [Lottia gigantea]|uniref:U3 small nucleolar RNA-associated protein 13 C-terminal domain-containing protein n=1 Tax=Lottia gigantea TaxID=225164 RepID=V3ZQH6_LOTGI|nr:hypothetical protein LOTGIDRAFT_221859 [Lottia gigantea]ESO84760.1 hypothetical protein LOTGIDRAFT_221859 [Lottia gigantea]